MAGAEGVDIHGRSANHTMNQKASGEVTGGGGAATRPNPHGDSTWKNPDKKKTSGGRSALIFPMDLGSSAEQQNFMMFWPKEITGGKGNAREITFADLDGYPAVALPIPAGLNTTYQQSWSQAQVAGRNSMLADKGGDLIKRVATSLRGRDMTGVDRGLAGAAKQARITDIVGSLMQGASMGGAWDMTKSVAGALTSADFWNESAGGVAEELGAMVAAGPAEGLATASQYNTGMRAVQQTMMSYGGPGFRSFTYTFSLKPMRQAESDIVNDITRVFKELSAPNQQSTRYTRVYDLPAVWRIRFYNGSFENTYISRIGHCALTSIAITYGGGKFSTFHGTHAPVQTDITLNFQEMELLNRQMLENEQYPGTAANWPTEDSSAGYVQTSGPYAGSGQIG